MFNASLDDIEAPKKAYSEVAAYDQQASYQFIDGRLGANVCEVQNPIKYDLQLVHWGDPACLVVLISFGLEHLGHEGGQTYHYYHH